MMARIKCAICEVKLKETYLERHIRRRHSDAIAPKKNKMNITCCLCQEKFSFRNDFRAHVETEHAKIEEKSFKLEGWEGMNNAYKIQQNIYPSLVAFEGNVNNFMFKQSF